VDEVNEKIQIEVTDTFGGESNYCWVKRYEIHETDKALTKRQIVLRAKKLAGWTGLRCKTYDNVDRIDIHPVGICQIMFIQLFYNQ